MVVFRRWSWTRGGCLVFFPLLVGFIPIPHVNCILEIGGGNGDQVVDVRWFPFGWEVGRFMHLCLDVGEVRTETHDEL